MAPSNMSADADARDMRAAAAGETAALGRLYDRHGRRVHAIAFHMLRDAQLAEDVTQETFIRIWKHAGRWTPDKAMVSTWVQRIASNLTIDYARKRREITGHLPADKPDTSTFTRPGAALESKQASQILRTAMAELPERQCLALVLTVDEDLSNAEAGQMMGVSEQAMESLLARARRNLRKMLISQKSLLMGTLND